MIIKLKVGKRVIDTWYEYMVIRAQTLVERMKCFFGPRYFWFTLFKKGSAIDTPKKYYRTNLI